MQKRSRKMKRSDSCLLVDTALQEENSISWAIDERLEANLELIWRDCKASGFRSSVAPTPSPSEFSLKIVVAYNGKR